jgi:pilus assembly protein Flp/PilA
MMSFIQQFLRDEEGATAIEYALIAALIAVAAVTAISHVGDAVESTFTTVYHNLTGTTPAP